MNIEIREKQLENGKVIKQRLFVFEDGLEVWCPEKSCIFCKHCTDIFYDSSGPYGFACKLDLMGEKDLFDKGYVGECELFKDGVEGEEE